MQGKLSLGVMAATRSAGERARNASAETSGITAAAGGMVTASKRDGEGERCRLGVQASVRRIPMTSPMRTELRPAGCVGGWGGRGWSGALALWFKGLAEHSHGRLTHSTGGCRARLTCDPGARVSQKAAAPEVEHLALAAKELVRTLGSVVSHRSLRIPDGAPHRPARVQVTVRTAAGAGGSHVFCFSRVGGKMNETSTRTTGTGGGAGC